MAESSSPALPGDVEWLPGPDGTRVLRIHPPSADPPTLILRVPGGGERRIEATPSTEYSIPAEVDWSAAWLQWPDGTRAALPLPHGPHAEVIELRPRRFARTEPPAEGGWRGEIAPPAREALETAGTGGPATGTGATAQTGELAATAYGSAAGATAGLAETAADPPAKAGTGALAAGTDGPAAGVTAGLGETATAAPGTGDLAADEDGSAAGATAGLGETAAVAPGTGDLAAGADGSAAGVTAGLGETATAAPGTGDLAAGGAAVARPADDSTGEHAQAGTWTTPPQLSDSTREAEAVWRERRNDLRRELAEAADAIARARDGERSARDAVLTALAAARADLRASRAAREADASALAAVSGELGAERAAHAVTRGSVGTLADALSAARAELAAAKTRGEATQAELNLARAELAAAKATGAAELAEARSDVAQARTEAASLRAALEAERDRPAVGRADLGRLAREQTEAAARQAPKTSPQLLANLDAAAAALRAAKPAAPPTDSAEADADGLEPARADGPEPGPALAATATTRPRADGPEPAPAATEDTPPRADGPEPAPGDETAPPRADGPEPAPAATEDTPPRADGPEPAPGAATEAAQAGAAGPGPALGAAPARSASPGEPTSTALATTGEDRRLRNALVALAREDGVAAGALLVGLLPAQGAAIESTVTYDLTVRGVGTFAVFVADGSARIVRLSRRRPRGQALFHLSAEPLVLAELLAGERAKVGRFRRRAKLSGKRKQARELLLLSDTRLSLADAVKAGARLEPGLVYRALPLAVDPEWTRGHSFTVAQQIAEFAPQAWHITARDGQPLRVVQRNTGTRADATVTMSKAAFERMLRDEPPAPSDRPQIRGDREAVAALKRWTDLARGA